MLTRRSFLAMPLALAQAAARPLNFVVILVDDWGATDLGCYGSAFYRTPNIDKLAASGMRFTQAYSACTVCSPSRAALLTGKYPARLHITDWIAGHSYPWAKLKPPDWTMYLPLAEQTIAEALKPAGYATISIGKWHLTTPDGDPNLLPDKQGFDRNVGGTFRGQPPSYFSPYHIETLPDGPPGEYLTDREAMEASRFITQNKDRPFLLYLPHYTVHTPIQAKPEKVRKYEAVMNPDAPQHNPAYAAMIESLDEAVGRLQQTLDQTGVADRTVIILTGDNGGWLPSTNKNLGLRAGKGSAYEGGVRVPFIVRWPGFTAPGSICGTPIIGCDIYPTLLEMAGQKPAAGQVIDGVSLVPLLKQAGRSNDWKRDALFWHYPHYHPGGATPYSAIRERDWKLIEFHEDMRVELYNLAADPEEKRDLANNEPARAEKLRKRLHRWREQVGAQMPVPNPAYDPTRAAEHPPGPRVKK
jgi:arylsulfatase A